MIEPDSPQPKPKRAIRGGVQPKHHAQKGKVAVAMRRKKIIKALAEGKTLKEAGIIGGLSEKTAATQVFQNLQKPTMMNALVSAMEKRGITDDCLSERLHTLLYGKKVIAANVFAPGSSTDLADAGSMTKDFVEVDDNVAIAKGIELACKIKGQFVDKHEVDMKAPIRVVIRKFCSRGEKPDGPGSGGATA